ncbi:MAG: DUF2934 domain-containing protein [Streptomyces sp.]|nr:DUF2934 domain-containing protein [Streptomyces sp.]NUS11392.1 DUF2934 domain-containing protein [Streptomyces sp.]NUS23467.1 DUF2934 domain-containing protein [Streptomyces sp.]
MQRGCACGTALRDWSQARAQRVPRYVARRRGRQPRWRLRR